MPRLTCHVSANETTNRWNRTKVTSSEIRWTEVGFKCRLETSWWEEVASDVKRESSTLTEQHCRKLRLQKQRMYGLSTANHSVKSFVRLTQKLYKNYPNTTKLTYCLSCDKLGECQGGWSRIRQSWQARKDHEDWHESRVEQAFTYWPLVPEVSPDGGKNWLKVKQ